MTCDDLVKGDILEAYVAGGLDEPTQADVERHVFECEACAARLDDLMLARAVLAEPRAEPELVLPPRRLSAAWYGQPLAIAAGVATLMFSAAGVVWWLGAGARDVAPGATAQAEAPSALPAPSTPPAPPAMQAASGPAGTTPAPEASPSPPPVDWAALSAFEAPALLALTLRGEAAAGTAMAAPLAEATAAYRAGRFREAADAFTRALESSDLTPPVAFYRGVSRLKTGSVEPGLGDLEAAIASGEAPYAVEAHLYVAYGRLLLHDAGRADEALARYVDLEGDFAAEARRLRQQVGRVAQRPR